MIRAVIFDMDGVLIEARDWHFAALNRALALFGYEISRADHLTRYDGLPTRRKLEILSQECGLPRSLHAFVDEMKQLYTMEAVHVSCKPSFVHEYALSSLAAMDYKLAVASNSKRATVDVMMQKAHLSGYLDCTLSASDVRRPKPDPEIYLATMRTLGIPPGDCLIVEDNEHGVRAGVAAGGHVLKVRDVHDVTLANILARIGEANAS